MSDIRSMIREILKEEIARLRDEPPTVQPPRREEVVSIRTDGDLAAFTRRLLKLAKDPNIRADMEAGRHVFKLASASQPATNVDTPQSTSPIRPVRFERGLITEKEVARLPDGLGAISIGKTVRFTPLARDELRRRGIKIERTKA